MKSKNFLLKRIITIASALIISIVVNYFFSASHEYWIPFAALLVMQASLGVYLRQGIQIFISIGLVVILYSFAMMAWHSSWQLMQLYYRLYDVTLGSAIGITVNLLLFPRQPDEEFREDAVILLKACSEYLAAIFHFLMDPTTNDAQEKKLQLEKILKQFSPIWVYQTGFSVALREGYRHFSVMLDRLEQILFSLHQTARYHFDPQLLDAMQSQLVIFFTNAEKIIHNLILILELKKMTERVSDLSEELVDLDRIIKKNSFAEAVELSNDSIYIAEWLENLKDLRMTLIVLAQSLR